LDYRLREIEEERMLAVNLQEKALQLHREAQGKLEIKSKVPVENGEDLSLAYSPGVAEPCKEIYARPEAIYEYTAKGNLVAVISDGTAVLGLGDIGPEAALPVMEGKAILFKSFAGVDAFPLCLATKDPDRIVETVKLLAPTFGGINLEDIAAPACFEIEERLKKELDIPVFHDDQHGTAIVVLAGLFNALQLVKKRMEELKIVINGSGAAGIAIFRLLHSLGAEEIIICDRQGTIYQGREKGMNPLKEEIAAISNKERVAGDLATALQGAHVFIGVSGPGMLTAKMVKSMAEDPLIFALANPVPEIMPEEAQAAGARIIGTGRSDYPNQINNVLAFPGIFRGALDVRAKVINEEMKIAAAKAIAALIQPHQLRDDYIIPQPFDSRVAPAVAQAVAQAARKTGVARL